MRGIVWHGPEQMSVEEVESPEVGPGQVVVRPEATGICGSEIEGYLGTMGNRTPARGVGSGRAGPARGAPGVCGSEIEGSLGKMGSRPPPLVMGHEFAGTVTEVGDGADEGLLGRTGAGNPPSPAGRRPPAR